MAIKAKGYGKIHFLETANVTPETAQMIKKTLLDLNDGEEPYKRVGIRDCGRGGME